MNEDWSDYTLQEIAAKEKKLGHPPGPIPEATALNLYLNDALTTINVQFAVKLQRLTITQPVRNSFKHLQFSGCTNLKTLTIRTVGEQAQDLSWLARLERAQSIIGNDTASSIGIDLSLSGLRKETPNHRQLGDRDMRTLAEFGLLNGNGAVLHPYTLNLAGHQMSLCGLAFIMDALSFLGTDQVERSASHRGLRCIDVRGNRVAVRPPHQKVLRDQRDDLLLYIAHHGRLGCADIKNVQRFLQEKKGQGDIDITILAGDIDRDEKVIPDARARNRVVQALSTQVAVLTKRTVWQLLSQCSITPALGILTDDLKLGEQEAESLRGQSTKELGCGTSTKLQHQWHPFPVPSLLLPDVVNGQFSVKRGEFVLGCGDCLRAVPENAGMFKLQLHAVKQFTVENVDLSEVEVPWLRFLTSLESLALIRCRISSLRDEFPTRLKFLDLKDNLITAWDPLWANTRRNLRVLNLKGNPLEATEDLFRMLEQNNTVLKCDELVHSALPTVTSRVEDLPSNHIAEKFILCGSPSCLLSLNGEQLARELPLLPSLTTIWIINVELTPKDHRFRFTHDTFPTAELQELHLCSWKYPRFDIGCPDFRNARDLVTFEVANLGINRVVLPQPTIEQAALLETVNIDRNLFFALSVETLFSPLPQDVSPVDRQTLTEYRSFRKLSARSNRINSIRSLQSVPQFRWLTYLDLTDNAIGELSERTFATMMFLEYLDLSHNALRIITAGAFPPSLKHIGLRDNLLTRLPEDLFARNSKLEELDLSWNFLEELPFPGRAITRCPPSLRKLNLDGNFLCESYRASEGKDISVTAELQWLGRSWPARKQTFTGANYIVCTDRIIRLDKPPERPGISSENGREFCFLPTLFPEDIAERQELLIKSLARQLPLSENSVALQDVISVRTTHRIRLPAVQPGRSVLPVVVMGQAENDMTELKEKDLRMLLAFVKLSERFRTHDWHYWADVWIRESGTTALSTLMGMLGIDELKAHLFYQVAHVHMHREREEKNWTSVHAALPAPRHMVFAGPPRTGKTTAAREMAQILYATGLLKSGTFVEASRATVVAAHQGETAKNVIELAKRAEGGILFIDEAYSLKNGSHDNFGAEAVAQLITEMENRRGKFVVILAGYKAEMDLFIASNPGFRSRIGHEFYFREFSAVDLVVLVQSELTKSRGTIYFESAEEKKLVDETLLEYMKCVEGDDEFANARGAREYAEAILYVWDAQIGSLATRSETLHSRLRLSYVQAAWRVYRPEGSLLQITELKDVLRDLNLLSLLHKFTAQRVGDAVLIYDQIDGDQLRGVLSDIGIPMLGDRLKIFNALLRRRSLMSLSKAAQKR